MSNFVPLFDKYNKKKTKKKCCALKTENQRTRHFYMNGYIVYETEYIITVVSRMSRKYYIFVVGVTYQVTI